MLAPEMVKHDVPQEQPLLPAGVLPAERAFYESYAWCLNPHLTVAKAAEHLRGEIEKLAALPPGWQADETITNVYLLSCGLLNCVDEHLRGPGLRLPWKLANTLPGRAGRWLADNVRDNLPPRRLSALRDWRERWLAALNDFLAVAVSDYAADPRAYIAAGGELGRLLDATAAGRSAGRARRHPVSVPPPRHDASRRAHARPMLCRAFPRPRAGDPAGRPAHLRLLFRAAAARPARGRRLHDGVVADARAKQGRRPPREPRTAALRRAGLHRRDRGRSAAHRRHHSERARDRAPRRI